MSRNATDLVFQVNNSATSNLTNLEVYFDTGRPHYNINRTAFYLMTPELASVFPTTGGLTGTKLYASIPGVGVNSTGTYTLTTDSDIDICTFTYWRSYSDMICYTNNATYASSILKVKNITSNVSKQCQSTSNQYCTFEQTAAVTGQPTITSAALSSDKTQITFTGTGFTGISANVSYKFVQADLTTINPDTELVA